MPAAWSEERADPLRFQQLKNGEIRRFVGDNKAVPQLFVVEP
jgi:hypothetical protein